MARLFEIQAASLLNWFFVFRFEVFSSVLCTFVHLLAPIGDAVLSQERSGHSVQISRIYIQVIFSLFTGTCCATDRHRCWRHDRRASCVISQSVPATVATYVHLAFHVRLWKVHPASPSRLHPLLWGGRAPVTDSIQLLTRSSIDKCDATHVQQFVAFVLLATNLSESCLIVCCLTSVLSPIHPSFTDWDLSLNSPFVWLQLICFHPFLNERLKASIEEKLRDSREGAREKMSIVVNYCFTIDKRWLWHLLNDVFSPQRGWPHNRGRHSQAADNTANRRVIHYLGQITSRIRLRRDSSTAFLFDECHFVNDAFLLRFDSPLFSPGNCLILLDWWP